MKKMKTRHLIGLIILVSSLSSCVNHPSDADQQFIKITDMANREVKIPKNISRIFCSDWTATMMMYSLAPNLLIGRNSEPTVYEKQYVTSYFYHLPALGYLFNGKSSVNIEQVINLNPDILLCPLFQHTSPANIKEFEDFGARIGIPVVMVNLDLEKLPQAYCFLGQLLHRSNYAKKLASYCKQTLALADSLKRTIKKPVSFYIAEGRNGLQTIPRNSTHSQIFKKTGLSNVAKIKDHFGYKDISINMEQIISWNPDFIIINQRSTSDDAASIENNKLWQTLRAVQNGQIIQVPNQPFNWIGRPPSINRLIGIKWLIASIYPGTTNLNINEEINYFYKLFYHKTLSPEEVQALLNNKAPNN
jgi:iron complex transport system substrate-binding protein